MKVLHFYRTYFPDTQGGLEEAIRQICLSSQSYGVESRILTLSQNPDPQVVHYPEADVFRAKLDLDIASCSMGVEAFSMFRALENWADIVHFHFPWPFADVVQLLAGSPAKPRIVTYHSDIVRQRWLEKLYRPVMHKFLQGMTRIIATSPNYVESSVILQQYIEKVEIIPIGLDEATYPPLNQCIVKDVESKYGNNFVLFIGVLREYKGLHVLLEAMKGVSCPLVIAGKGPLAPQLSTQAKKLGLTNVHYAGYVSDEVKIALLHCCKALVLPSHLRSEAFGVSLLEGAMMAKPLISAEIGTGTSYVNEDGVTGLVCEPSDPSSLREAIVRVISDNVFADRMGAGARLQFEKLFTADGMGAAYTRIYDSALRASI